VRDQQAFTLEQAVRLITYDTATHWGFHDRGLLREGMAADLAVFDPATIAPRMPEGSVRPAGRRQAPEADRRWHARDRGQRPGAAAQQPADRRAARPAVCAAASRAERPHGTRHDRADAAPRVPYPRRS